MRTAICLALLLLTPLAVYWGTAFHEYGFRDDYSHLREAHDEPGKLLRVTASNGRPVYGILLEPSVRLLRGVADLPWLRFMSVLLLTGVAVVLWRQLKGAGWSDPEAVAIGLAVALLPAAQVIASWAIAWPITLAALLGVTGFALVEARLAQRGWQRTAAVAAGGTLYFLAGLIYQSNALLAVVPLAAVLLTRSGSSVGAHARWVAVHLTILFLSLVAGFVLVEIALSQGVLPPTTRLMFETNPFGKLVWFVREPVANALALFALRDRFNTGAVFFWSALLLSLFAIALGWRFGPKERSHRVRWLVSLLFLPFVAHSMSLASSNWIIGYRTLFALSGLTVVLVIFGLRSVRVSGRIGERQQHAALAAFVLVAAISAGYNAYALIAEPQNREWNAMREAVDRVALEVDTSVYIITPTPGVRSTRRMFSDEFGSLSSDSDWVPREMFKHAMRERFPEGVPSGCKVTLTTSREAPEAALDFDAVIDLRRFKDESAEPPAGYLISMVPDPDSCPVKKATAAAR